MTPSPVRVRYAPSPTGFLHVGGARTLLFNWLYARKLGGKLILRVEDTDQARSQRKHEEMILSDVRKLGLAADESPELGGPHTPYRQSERLKIYADHARRLRDENRAYYCFCSDETLGKKREVALKLGRPPHYDGTCAKLPPDEAIARLKSGEKAGLRFRAYDEDMTLTDEVRGQVVFKRGMVGDFLITRTPGAGESEIAEGIGFPVYNFCCVIDDHLMEMSHVIRGEDHLSNTARQLMIFRAFDWAPPKFAHTAMVLGSDRQKLSKRNGDVSVHEYLDKGFLPEALLNFLALLGWWPSADVKPKSGHPEVLSLSELIEAFDLGGLQKAPAVFDLQKLRWMNGQYIKLLPLAEIAERARPFFEAHGVGGPLAGRFQDRPWMESLVDAVRGEVQLLSEIPKAAEMFFEQVPHLDDEALAVLKSEGATQVVAALESQIAALSGESIDVAGVEALQKEVGASTGAKGKGLFMPMRAAITGKTHGPELKRVLPLLGRAAALARVREVRKLASV